MVDDDSLNDFQRQPDFPGSSSPAYFASVPAPGRMRIGIISAGKVGTVLGSALRAAGHQVIGAYARSAASRERLEAMLPGVPAVDIPEIVERSELVVLAIPTASIEPLVEQVAQQGLWRPGQIVVHTAGRVGGAVLAPAARCGALCLAIHPAMSFTGTSLDVARLRSCFFAVTAPAPLQPIGHALAAELGGESVVVAEADRPAYHLAVRHTARHVGAVVEQSMQLLVSLGIESPGDLLRSLAESALQRALGTSGEQLANLSADVGSGGDATYVQIAADLEREDPAFAHLARVYRALEE
ncbi:MAG: DUF2520 domain-containing protein [Actinomycetaceae bacterium]|nr:DUF2520 domain-containing protein [Actinomycetaceae bacterium]MDY5854174.1 DUF2520 domain-containing protein [Arcanobacterium sp.]